MAARMSEILVATSYVLCIICPNPWWILQKFMRLKRKAFIAFRNPKSAARIAHPFFISIVNINLYALIGPKLNFGSAVDFKFIFSKTREFCLFLMKNWQTWPSVVTLVPIIFIVLLLWMRKILAAGFGFLYKINAFLLSPKVPIRPGTSTAFFPWLVSEFGVLSTNTWCFLL